MGRVDEHIDGSCDCVSHFQTEVVSKEKVSGIIDDCELHACRTGDCVDKVNGYTCDCDEDRELMLQLNGSACVARNVKISFSNMVQWNRRGSDRKSKGCEVPFKSLEPTTCVLSRGGCV